MRIGSPSGRAVVASIVVVMLGLSPAYMTGALGLQIRAELGIGATELGLAIGAFFAATAMLSPLLGSIADRIGTVRGLRLAMLLVMVSSLMMVLTVGSYLALLVALVVGGISNGIAGPATSRLVAYHVHRRRSLAFGLRQAAVPLATLVAGISVPVVGLTLGWRFAFMLVGLAALPVALAAGGAVVGVEPRGVRASGRVSDLKGLLLAAVAFLFATAAGTALMSFVVDLSVDRGLGEATGGLVLSIVSIAGIIVRIGVGWLADRPEVDAFAIMNRQILIGLGGFLLLVLPSGTLGLIVGASLAIAGGWGWTGLMAHVVAQGSPDGPARAAGIVQTGGASGGVLGPPIAGFLIDNVSHGAAWTVAFCLLLVALVAVRAVGRSTLADRFREGPTIIEVGT
jgi:MFS family permease